MLADGWVVAGISRSASDPLGDHHQHRVLDVRAPDDRTALAAVCEQHGPFDAAIGSQDVGTVSGARLAV